jgi:hypothetical protein
MFNGSDKQSGHGQVGTCVEHPLVITKETKRLDLTGVDNRVLVNAPSPNMGCVSRNVLEPCPRPTFSENPWAPSRLSM